VLSRNLLSGKPSLSISSSVFELYLFKVGTNYGSERVNRIQIGPFGGSQ